MSRTNELEICTIKFLMNGKTRKDPDLLVEYDGGGDICGVQAYNETLDMWLPVDLETISKPLFQNLLEQVSEQIWSEQNERGSV